MVCDVEQLVKTADSCRHRKQAGQQDDGEISTMGNQPDITQQSVTDTPDRVADTPDRVAVLTSDSAKIDNPVFSRSSERLTLDPTEAIKGRDDDDDLQFEVHPKLSCSIVLSHIAAPLSYHVDMLNCVMMLTCSIVLSCIAAPLSYHIDMLHCVMMLTCSIVLSRIAAPVCYHIDMLHCVITYSSSSVLSHRHAPWCYDVDVFHCVITYSSSSVL